jgi:hypothetical protein
MAVVIDLWAGNPRVFCDISQASPRGSAVTNEQGTTTLGRVGQEVRGSASSEICWFVKQHAAWWAACLYDLLPMPDKIGFRENRLPQGQYRSRLMRGSRKTFHCLD